MEQGGVEIPVRSQLMKIVEDLEKIQKSGASVAQQLKTLSGDLGKETRNQTKQVEDQLEKTKTFGRRVADQLKKDFSALFSIQSIGAGLKLSEQFSGTLKESMALSDAVRKFSGIFGIAGKDFVHFQNLMQSGLGEIGASSEAAANALKGLAETPVRGEQNLLRYSKTAAQLAGISGEKGNEGGIAKGLAGVIQAQGGNVNDRASLGATTDEVLKIRRATGKSISEITAALSDIYSKTNADFQKTLKSGGAVTLASAALQGGPQATAFLESYLSKSKYQRAGAEAQGLGRLVNSKGEMDPKAFAATIAEANRRMPGNVQGGLQTMGMGEDEAKGFMRLSEAIKANGSVINGAKDQVIDLNQEYRKTMTLGDAFRANINKVKSLFSPVISAVSQGGTEAMSHTAGNLGGAAVVTAGAGILSAILVGGGLRGAGKALGLGGLAGGEAKSAAIEALTGEHVQRVEVINWPSSFGSIAESVMGGGIAGKVGKLAKLGGLAGVGTTAALGTAAVGTGLAAGQLAKYVGEGSLESDLTSIFKRVFSKQEAPISGFPRPAEVKVSVESKKRDLKAAALPGRGSSQ